MVRAMAVTALRSANSLDRLGSAWLVLTPLFLAALYYFAFGVLLGTGRGIDNFVGFLIVGVFLFQYAARILGEGSKSITASRRLIRGFHFPRLVLPLAVVVRLMLAFAPALAVLLGIALATVPPQNVTWRWLLVVPAVLLLTAFCAGLVLVLARLTSQVHDLVNVIPFFVRGWMYFSGVFYSVERFAQDATARAVLEANPMHIYLTLARDALLYARSPSADDWTAGAAWAAGTCGLGLIVFWRGEESYSRE
jgi:teichoic acid transport system permease protein